MDYIKLRAKKARGLNLKIEITDCAVRFSEPTMGIKGRKPVEALEKKRGKQEGFSKHSRVRLREVLWGLAYDGACGVTLTSPPWCGPERAIYDTVMDRLRHKKTGRFYMVARKEVTKSGREHYHCIVQNSKDADTLRDAWRYACCEKIDSKLWPKLTKRGKPWTISFAVKWLDRKSVEIAPIADSDKAAKYLLDHTSKKKQYQCLTKGRAWIERYKPLKRSAPILEGDILFNRKNRLKRICSKLGRIRISTEKHKKPCVFGYKLTKRTKRLNNSSKHVLFGKEQIRAVKRFCDMEDIPYPLAQLQFSRASDASKLFSRILWEIAERQAGAGVQPL